MSKRKGTLTPRQRAFVNVYYEDPARNASRAYLKAGYAATGKAVKNNASRLMRHPDVRAEMARRDTALHERHENSIDALIAKAEMIREEAIAERRWRDALVANDQVARLTGAYPAPRRDVAPNLQELLKSALLLDPNDSDFTIEDVKKEE